MYPLPVKPKVVIYVNDDATIQDTANNIGNDLEIVVAYSRSEFNQAALGVPYKGTDVLVEDEKS